MTIRTTLSVAGLLLASAVLGSNPSTADEAAAASPPCDRACLTGIADKYMAAMLAHDPTRVTWAKHVEFTENSVPMRIGDGLWNTITKQDAYKLYFADPQGGQVGFYGVVEESGVQQVYGLRLKVERGAVSEVETVIARKRDTRADFPNAAGLADKPIFSRTVPPAHRETREQLVQIANSYFETLQQNDGTIKAPFAATCDRVEDGVHTTNNPARAAGSGNGFPQWGCEAQFKTGFFHFVTHIRDRRFPVVDVERGLVLVSTFFDHAGSMRTVTLTDGTTRHIGAPFDAPYSFVIFELFKIQDGKIQRVEAVLEDVPYKTLTAWEN
jgi:hypothetical protein